MVNLHRKNSKLLLLYSSNNKNNKNSINNNITTTKKCRDRFRNPTTTNTALLVTYNDHKPLTDFANSSISDTVWDLYAPLKQLIYHLTRWIGVEYPAQIPCWNYTPIFDLFFVINYTFKDFKVSVLLQC